MAEDDLLLELARFVERVSAIARTGLAFKSEGYDAERYDELLRSAAEMHTVASREDRPDPERIRKAWRESVVSGYDGYVTPAIGCGAIVFNERDELLMMQRPTGRWWYPTGFCDVGLSPAENMAKEVREETGLVVRASRIIALLDSRKAGSAARHIYTVLFYCTREGGALRPSPLEALDARFFPIDELPSPLHGKDPRWLALAREFHFAGRTETYFDTI